MKLNTFETRTEAAVAVARRIENALFRQLKTKESAAIVVSGGTTPAPAFAHMSHSTLDWHRVTVVLSDERWVPVEHDDSNEKMLRDSLATSRASYAEIVPYFESGTTLEERCSSVDVTLRELPLPFTCSLLGMGKDGHFASLFPDAEDLSAALDIDNPKLCVPIKTKSSSHKRMSLTLAALTMSDEILLLIFGDAKRAVLEQVIGSGRDLPVTHLLQQTRAPVQVFWAP